MNNRRWWAVTLAVLAAVGITAVGAALWGDDDGGVTTAPRMVPSTTTAPSTSTSTSVSTSTPSTSTTSTPPPRTSPPTTKPRVTVPATVTVISARSGGGSGEIVLDWKAVATATGYQVLRAGTAEGPFSIAADFSVRTGKTTAGNDVVNLWSQEHTYVPASGSLGAPDQSPSFEYVQVGLPQQYFRVVAYNAAGTAPPSASVCGVVPGRPAC